MSARTGLWEAWVSNHPGPPGPVWFLVVRKLAYRDPHFQYLGPSGSPCAARSEGQLRIVRRDSTSLWITCLLIPDGPGMIFEPIADESYLPSCLRLTEDFRSDRFADDENEFSDDVLCKDHR
jgi:hypothetical protein